MDSAPSLSLYQFYPLLVMKQRYYQVRYYQHIQAASFVVSSIENTLDDPNHNYGVKFEPLLAQYIGGKK